MRAEPPLRAELLRAVPLLPERLRELPDALLLLRAEPPLRVLLLPEALDRLAVDRLAVERDVLPLFAVERVLFDAGFAVERFAVDRLAVERFAVERLAVERLAVDRFAVERFAVERFAAPPLLAALPADLRVDAPPDFRAVDFRAVPPLRALLLRAEPVPERLEDERLVDFRVAMTVLLCGRYAPRVCKI